MTKEDLESRGWELYHDFQGLMYFRKGIMDDGFVGAYLDVSGNKIILTTRDDRYSTDGACMSTKFNGKCESIEQFDTICEWVELKL